MKLKFLKYLIAFFLFFIFGLVWAYDYTINDSIYTINDSYKIKVDLFIKKKVTSIIIANKYITALNKINPTSLKNPNTKNIYYYLKCKLYIYVDENTPIAPIVPKTVIQKPINTPITLPWITISDIARIDTTNKLSTDKKATIDKLRSATKEYIELDKNMEFVEHGSYYRVKFSQYYEIKWNVPISLYLELWWLKNEVLIRQWDVFKLSSWGYIIEKKYSIKDLTQKVLFSWYWTWNMIFENKNWYYIVYWLYRYKFYTIPKTWIYISEYPWVSDLSKVILLQQKDKYILATWFEENKLFNTSLLLNNENPALILTSVWLDNYFYKTKDIESIFTTIKNKTTEIIKTAKNDNEKISAIYSWITWNINYDNYTTRYLKWEFSESVYLANVNKSVFSWLETFRNKSWVCDGYSKLMQYMLWFAWINNVSIEIGNADIGKWKQIPHARIKIGNLYYDPTWDYTTRWDISKFKRFSITDWEIHKTHIPSQ